MSRLFLDITELASWQGKLTGIPRVTSELAARFYDRGSATLVTWNGGYKTLCETGLPATHTRDRVSLQPPAHTLGLEHIKRLIRRSALVSKLAQGAVNSAHALAQQGTTNLSVNVCTLESSDTLVIFADWHGSDANFVEYLQNIHLQGVRIVQFSYDLLPIVAPQYSGHATTYITRYTKEIYPICDLIIADSVNTKRDIERWLATNKLTIPPVVVIRLGDNFQAAQPKRPAALDANLRQHFLLCVGTVEARKNHTVIYYAYKLAHRQGIDLPPTIVVGRKGWLANDIFEIASTDPETKQRIIFMQDISDEELAWLYQHCLFTVYPSFYEGWGLPVAESLARGVPCLCSNTSSIPEIAGDLVDYFEPASPEALLAQVQRLLEPEYLAKVRRRTKRYKTTTWDNTYQAVRNYIMEDSDG